MKKKFPSISVSSGIIATKVRYIDINGIFLKTIDKTVKSVPLEEQTKQLSHIMQKLPAAGETIRFLTSKDGFSSIAFIDYIYYTTDGKFIEHFNLPSIPYNQLHWQKADNHH